MINRWDVMQYVAGRYGKLQPIFEDNARKVAMVRAGEVPLVSIEDNMERVKLRVARENETLPVAIERINGSVDFQDKCVVDIISDLSKSVCRLLKDGSPIGTGFLVAKNIIITNHHVIQNMQDAKDMLAEFDYELDKNKIPKKTTLFRINPDVFFLTSSLEANKSIPFSGLDFTLIGLDSTGIQGEQLTDYSPVYLDGNSGKIIKGENCIVVQHPNGLPKKIVLKNTAFFSETETRIVYETDTLPGSSGSMVIGLGTCEVIALHHAGLPRTDASKNILKKDGNIAGPGTRDADIDWLGNEGIKVSKIIEALESADLPDGMEEGRRALLRKTGLVKDQLDKATTSGKPTQKNESENEKLAASKSFKQDTMSQQTSNPRAHFLLVARYDDRTIERISSILRSKYGPDTEFLLAMPSSAMRNTMELFSLSVPFTGDLESEARNLVLIPGIQYAEADVPLRLNVARETPTDREAATESFISGDGYSEPNEDEFLKKYTRKHSSKYVPKDDPNTYRRWNWLATSFDKVIANADFANELKNIRIVQFDTGFTNHTKVRGGFDTDHDHNFIENPDDASDPGINGILRQPWHGTRTGSLIIGKEITEVAGNGNCGLLSLFAYKLVPYRISQSVILVDRQKQLSDALDLALAQRYDIITMSMGLPPTIATAVMAKKAYDAGIIWCCAAGNEVQAVIAPAVYPGTIAVAASNPLDRDWPASSRGDAVDITAPGQDVYVPIFIKPKNGEKAGEGFAYGDGTSYATPHVAAAAACWLAKHKAELERLGYTGWKRVEAFREALRISARRENDLPTEGFGHGMLDAEALLNIHPGNDEIKLEYKYDGWNESNLFDVIQAYGEMAKTYWNRLHDMIFGAPRGGQEAMIPQEQVLSEFSRQLEKELFKTALNTSESTAALTIEELQNRFITLHNIIESSAKN